MHELPCIVCGETPDSVFGAPHDDVTNSPYAATVFRASGQYGSTVFDPMDGASLLEINVCDACLRGRAERVLHVTPTRTPPVPDTYVPWVPDADEA